MQKDHLFVVLVETSNPLNMGAAARAMSNFGFLHLRVVKPYDIAYREARSAVGAAASVLADAKEYDRVADAVADCELVIGTTAVGHRELNHPLRTLEDAGREIRERMSSRRVAILFGPEKTGLSNDDLSHCHWLMHITTRHEQLSMNLGQAVAVCLYEIVRDAKAAMASAPKEHQPAQAGEIGRISSVLLEGLHASGYVNPISVTSTEERVRRMVRRLNLSAEDAELWLGMYRQMLWKMKSDRTDKN